MVSAIFALLLKLADERGMVGVHHTIENNAAFGMYTSTLVFLLIFRTSKCYSRFWHCATSMCTFRAELVEAAKSLIAFTEMSNASMAEIDHLKRSVVTFSSLLHATALVNLSDCPLDKFPVIDMAAVTEYVVQRLQAYTPKNRVDLVYMWLNGVIVRAMKTGLLNVPPPILSRVFQQTEKAMVEYNQVLEVMTIPFPFPYAQTAYVLLVLMGVSTPFAMCSWTNHPAAAFALTFTGVMCLVSLELIARQLENPFGEDANDLPIDSFQDLINESLMLMATDDASNLPNLSFVPRPERSPAHAFGALFKVVQGDIIIKQDSDCIQCITIPGELNSLDNV
jgi:putative membrane protein